MGIGFITSWYIKQIDKYFTWDNRPHLRLLITFAIVIIAAFCIPFISIYYFNLSTPLFGIAFWIIVLGLFAWFSLIYTIEETYTFVEENVELKAKSEQIG